MSSFLAKFYGSPTAKSLSIAKRLASTYSVRQIGEPNTSSYRSYLQNENGDPISALHDIPIKETNSNDGVYNMIIEVPRWTNAKLEISRDQELNPIVQDTKNDKLRYVANVFPFKGYIHNYGAIPQTWENPEHVDPRTKAGGDDDPIDVCEIGQTIGYTGEVRQVKVLGCMPLIDEGETDWKVLGISIDDPLANELNDIEDIEKHFPGLINATHNWFRDYKVPDGKPQNVLGEIRNRKETIDIINDCHKAWSKLIQQKNNKFGINETNTTLEDTPGYEESAGNKIPDGKTIHGKQPSSEPEKWNFINK